MRVEIKTKGIVTDNDVRALYLINEAMKISSPHMRMVNLKFVEEQWNSQPSEGSQGKRG